MPAFIDLDTVMPMARRIASRGRQLEKVTAMWRGVMTVYACWWVASDGHVGWWSILAVTLTLLLGIVIGVQRHLTSLITAPMGLWLVAVLPVYITSLWHRPFLAGVVHGFLDVTIGALVVSLSMTFLLSLIAIPVRLVVPARSRPAVEIFGPNDSRS